MSGGRIDQLAKLLEDYKNLLDQYFSILHQEKLNDDLLALIEGELDALDDFLFDHKNLNNVDRKSFSDCLLDDFKQKSETEIEAEYTDEKKDQIADQLEHLYFLIDLLSGGYFADQAMEESSPQSVLIKHCEHRLNVSSRFFSYEMTSGFADKLSRNSKRWKAALQAGKFTRDKHDLIEHIEFAPHENTDIQIGHALISNARLPSELAQSISTAYNKTISQARTSDVVTSERINNLLAGYVTLILGMQHARNRLSRKFFGGKTVEKLDQLINQCINKLEKGLLSENGLRCMQQEFLEVARNHTYRIFNTKKTKTRVIAEHVVQKSGNAQFDPKKTLANSTLMINRVIMDSLLPPKIKDRVGGLRSIITTTLIELEKLKRINNDADQVLLQKIESAQNLQLKPNLEFSDVSDLLKGIEHAIPDEVVGDPRRCFLQKAHQWETHFAYLVDTFPLSGFEKALASRSCTPVSAAPSTDVSQTSASPKNWVPRRGAWESKADPSPVASSL